ncbi:hypothetical protein [Flavobacterium branchiicola]|uniref:Lipoprotein n=1 Tax=Flavobacterium branchiicola TaxID=1114875 RepID=A0ABV9PJ60_9FLAO|nr:hypothetical protein [Flavobacterium branchiicola]MBS7255110.1 hypothetical protein [Flavobacterium branchiicola]
MKIRSIILCILIVNIVSCQKKDESNINNQNGFIKKESIMKDANLIKILTKQIEAGNDQTYSAFIDYDKSDLDESVKIIDTILNNNGYKKISNEDFSTKIKNIFGRVIDEKSEIPYLKVDTYKDNICNRKLEYYPFSVDAQYLYITKSSKFITYFYPLPEIIDYQKIFPQLKKYEDDDIIIEDKIENIKIRASQWKDVKDLAELRKKNIQILVARNMYLFNDSRAYFKWLILNDEIFMRSLVTTFGYYDDKELVKWVVDKTEFTNKNIDEVNKIIYNKKCDGKIVFDRQMLNVLVEDEAKATQFYELIRYDYMDWLLSDKNSSELTFSQKAEIIAQIQSFIYSHAKDYRIENFMGKFAEYNDSDNKYSKEFKLKNYYNIPEFEKQWKQAKIEGDGISLPGEE